MANRVLRWHILGVLSKTGVVDTDVQGNAYKADKDYTPTDTWLRVKTAPQGTQGTGIKIDINDDGVSIYGEGHEPVLPDNTTEATCNNFASPEVVIKEGSIITLDIDRVGSEYAGKDFVVELYLDEA